MGSQPKVPDNIKDDNRDVSDLWRDALKKYQGIVGFSLEPKYANVDAMIAAGVNEMNNFHKFRHNEKKVDKLRSLFAANMDFIESGTQQLIGAATPAFPPAAAIGTAVTFMLSACRQVSADYDIVVVFFEDMNAFLQRIVILESRMPKYKAYQNCLMDVFTSFLTMCGFAHKYIELGRFKKWIQNLMFGKDSELGGARGDMDTKLARLQSATEFAILGNTEEIQKMSSELTKVQEQHTAFLLEQKQTLGSIQDDTEHIRSDMSKLLAVLSAQKKESGKEQKRSAAADQGKPPSAKRIRNTLPEVEDEIHEYHILKETLVEDTCTWVFSEQQWTDWIKYGHEGPETHPILAITGEPGMGKSHIAATVFDKLWELATQDESKHTCAAHFYFREQHKSLSTFISAIVTVVNQVVEQSGPLCEKINAENLNDEVVIDVWEWKDLVNKLLAPCFSHESKYCLRLVLDGVDELQDHTPLREFLGIVKEHNLNISIVITTRPSALDAVSGISPVVHLPVTKEKQTEDMKSFIWSRVNTLSPLRTFGRYVKQSVADKAEKESPNMLYAQHLLSQWNGLGREGAVLRSLNKPLPSTLHELYEVRLETCCRRTGSDHQNIVKFLLHLVSYSFRSPNLIEVNTLLQHLTGDSEFTVDEIPETFTYFLRIGDPGSDAEARAKIQSQGGWRTAVQDLEKTSVDNPDRVYNDNMLPVKFHERSMRSFFRDAYATKGDSQLRWSPSEAHRRIFLVAVELARHVPDADPKKLMGTFRWYATHHTLKHWREIDPDQHSVEEQVTVMDALWVLLTDQHGFAGMVEWNGSRYQEIFGDKGFQRIIQWARLADTEVNLHLSEGAAQWWKNLTNDHKQALIPLAKSHLTRVCQAGGLDKSVISFGCLKSALQTSELTSLFDQRAEDSPPPLEKTTKDNPDFPKAFVKGLAGLFNLEMNGQAYRNVAELLLKSKQREEAEAMCSKALEALNEDQPLEQFKALVLMAEILSKRGRVKRAHEFVVLFAEKLDRDDIPPAVKRKAFIVRARIEAKRDLKEAAASSFKAAKAADPSNVTPGDVLMEELDLYSEAEDYGSFISTLKSWTPLERLTCLTWKYEDSYEFHCQLLDIADATGEVAFMTSVYDETIQYLDNVNAGAPLRLRLAQLYIELREDLQSARRVLDEVLDSSSTGWPYAVTDEDADSTLELALTAQSDVLFALFIASSDPVVKKELFDSAKGLITRPLALDVPPASDTWLLHYRLNVARMHSKMGPAVEFQRMLQNVIDACIEALTDKVGWNDSANMVILSKALYFLSKAAPNGAELRHASDIFAAARFSRLSSSPTIDDEDDAESDEDDDDESDVGDEDEEEDEEHDGENDDGEDASGEASDDDEPPTDEGDLEDVEWGCDGSCMAILSWWGGRVVYQCMTCENLLCEPCYEARMADNRGETPLKGRKYCGRNHEYVKAPMEGWKGITDGKIMVGEEEVAVNELLDRVKGELCKKAWQSFWVGE